MASLLFTAVSLVVLQFDLIIFIIEALNQQFSVLPGDKLSAKRRHVAAEGFGSLAAVGLPRAAGPSVLRQERACSDGKLLHLVGQDAVQLGGGRRRRRGQAGGQMREPGGALERQSHHFEL